VKFSIIRMGNELILHGLCNNTHARKAGHQNMNSLHGVGEGGVLKLLKKITTQTKKWPISLLVALQLF
jgi:hypothetical protein